jgi:hypothetical protein
MGYRICITVALAALGFAVTTLWSAFGQAPTSSNTSYEHPGRAVDIISYAPVNASVKAWPQSLRTGTAGDCPLYGNTPLDATITHGGDFALVIPTSNHTYTVTYCASGYQPRADRDLPNRGNRSFIVPMTAGLYPLNNQNNDALADAIERQAVGAVNNLAYLRSVNADQFNTVMNRLAEDIAADSQSHAAAIRALSSLVAEWDNR